MTARNGLWILERDALEIYTDLMIYRGLRVIFVFVLIFQARREDLQQRLDRQVLRVEALEAELYQNKEVMTRLNREKNALEAEVNVLRVREGQRSQVCCVIMIG
jgi:hypothetical protein